MTVTSDRDRARESPLLSIFFVGERMEYIYLFFLKPHGLYHIPWNQATIILVIEVEETKEEGKRRRRRIMNYFLLKYSSRSLRQRTVVVVVGIQTESGSAHIVLLKTHIMADLTVKSVDFLCSSYLM